MDDAKKQLVEKLKTANNILVTVRRDPTVDQLSSCLGLALALNKLGKHTAAVFSGAIPSIIEFLQPEDTLEKNTDSLRDFIIALDKSKADKLRYKVEDNVVRIFITPYKTSISQQDLDFSQGDFNVDLLVALGVSQQEELDEAIMAHGRILHDATVASVNVIPEGGLGSINWHDPQASSLSELVTDLIRAVDPNLLDGQIATALLTGIVSATDRFSNDKTSSQTMSISSALMAAGANQQLVASKLKEPEPEPETKVITTNTDDKKDVEEENVPDKASDDGTIEIEHPIEPADLPILDLPTLKDDNIDTSSADVDNLDTSAETKVSDPVVDSLEPPIPLSPDFTKNAATQEPPVNLSPGAKLITGPPTLGGTLTANSQTPNLDPVTDPMSLPSSDPPRLMQRNNDLPPVFSPPPIDWSAPNTPVSSTSTPPPSPVITPSVQSPPASPQTPPISSEPANEHEAKPDHAPSLSELEAKVKQAEGQSDKEDVKDQAAGLDDARDEVDRALNTAAATMPPKPIEALNAQPLGDNLHTESTAPLPTSVNIPDTSVTPDAAIPYPNLPQSDAPVIVKPTAKPDELSTKSTSQPEVINSNAPPPVPPPIPFKFGASNPPKQT